MLKILELHVNSFQSAAVLYSLGRESSRMKQKYKQELEKQTVNKNQNVLEFGKNYYFLKFLIYDYLEKQYENYKCSQWPDSCR